MEESKQKTIIDYAAILSIGGVILYQMGWTYWSYYFESLNIDASFIDIPFETIISTTWANLVFVLLMYYSIIQDYYKTKDKTDVINFIFILLSYLLIMINTISDFKKSLLYYYVGLAITYLIINFVLKFKKKPRWEMQKKTFLYVISISIYLISLFTYAYKGAIKGAKMAEKYEENIKITYATDQITYGKLIYFMNNKYFIIIETDECNKETMIINNDEIRRVEFINKKYKSSDDTLRLMLLLK